MKITKKKVIVSIILAVILFAGVFAYKFMLGKPFTVNQLYLRTFVKVMLNDPELLTTLGLIDNSNFDFYSDDLTDAGPKHEEKVQAIYKKDLELMKRYKTDGMSESEKLTYDIFEWYLQNEVDGEKYKYHNYPVNQFNGIQNELPELLVSTQQVKNKKDVKNYIERLSKVDSKFDGLLEGLKLREEKGIIPPDFILKKVIKEMEQFISMEPEKNVLVTSLAEKLNKINNLKEKDKKALIGKAASQTEKSVYPAYKKLIEYLYKLQTKATDNAGVWALPDGDAYYAYKLKSYTTTNLTPEQVHNIGLSEVGRIEKEMGEAMEKLGVRDITPGEYMKRLSNDSRFKYVDSEEGRQSVIKDYEQAIKDNDALTASCFDIHTNMGVEVKPVPEFKQDTAEQAYLVPGSSNGSKPSVLYINLGKINDIQKYNVKTMAAHETIPGHHMQRGIQRQLKGVPMFRTAVPFTAFAEGWAMYAEKLLWEQNTEKDPYDNLGRLQFELWRAARLVVDTGIHYKRWSREEAIEYMMNTTGMPENTVTIEVERYIADPGQACAYKVGMMKHLELREKARQELGDKFDLKKYHDAVLENGAMPLELLEKQVERYINNNRD